MSSCHLYSTSAKWACAVVRHHKAIRSNNCDYFTIRILKSSMNAVIRNCKHTVRLSHRSLLVEKLLFLSLLLLAAGFSFAQSPELVTGGTVYGAVKSGNQPIPGVTVTAANNLTGQKVMTSTGVDGRYSLRIPANGRYVIRAQMAAFAPATQTVLINSASSNVQINLDLMLASRAEQVAQAE